MAKTKDGRPAFLIVEEALTAAPAKTMQRRDLYKKLVPDKLSHVTFNRILKKSNERLTVYKSTTKTSGRQITFITLLDDQSILSENQKNLLLEKLKDEDWETRLAAATWLNSCAGTKILPQDVLAAAISCLNDEKYKATRAPITTGLIKITEFQKDLGDDTRNEIYTSLKDMLINETDFSIIRNAIRILCNLYDERVVDDLLAMVKNYDNSKYYELYPTIVSGLKRLRQFFEFKIMENLFKLLASKDDELIKRAKGIQFGLITP